MTDPRLGDTVRSVWPTVTMRASDRFVLGLDIGQSIDPSAVCVLQHVRRPLGTWVPDDRAKRWRQAVDEKFLVRHLERLPLGTPYPLQVEHVARLLDRPPLNDGCDFALDFTGCGRPVADMFVRAGLRPRCILITGGNEITQPAPAQWNVPKLTLISQLEARLHSGELKIAPAIVESEALKGELKDFSRKVSEAGRVTYDARSGAHDDLVLAVAIALFVALNRNVVSSEPLFEFLSKGEFRS
jgi:hypothetical protein